MTDTPQPPERMTAVFECDLRLIEGNPHKIDTPFGRAVVLFRGDLAKDHAAALAERDAALRSRDEWKRGWYQLDQDTKAELQQAKARERDAALARIERLEGLIHAALNTRVEYDLEWQLDARAELADKDAAP